MTCKLSPYLDFGFVALHLRLLVTVTLDGSRLISHLLCSSRDLSLYRAYARSLKHKRPLFPLMDIVDHGFCPFLLPVLSEAVRHLFPFCVKLLALGFMVLDSFVQDSFCLLMSPWYPRLATSLQLTKRIAPWFL
jgi:hypothetical protein